MERMRIEMFTSGTRVICCCCCWSVKGEPALLDDREILRCFGQLYSVLASTASIVQLHTGTPRPSFFFCQKGGSIQ